jgi:inorganic pyrophosphatase/exopolyphosphatase
LTDASETIGLSEKINPDQVIEIIDHRRDNAKEEFKNAKAQIELVGACATLITEKFIKEKIKPSRESAILLYLAIVSNTINFKNKITTSRDKNAAKYLKQKYKIDKNLIHQMFLHKSNLSDKTIEELFEEDRFVNIHAGKRFTIFQLEIAEVEKFVSQNKEEIILELEKIKVGEKAVITFLSCIDLEKAENTFVAPDKSTQKFLSKTFGVRFENQIARHKGIIMRKEIVPLVKEFL